MELDHQILSAQLGNQAAFADLLNQHYNLVYGLALSIVRDGAAAEDIAQEVWLAVWMNLGQLRNARVFPFWLRRIARNCALNWLRDERYRKALAEGPAQRAANNLDAGNPCRAAGRQEEFQRLLGAISALSPKLREAMTFHFLQGLSVADSAAALGITEHSMRKRIQMGCRRLQDKRRRESEFDLRPLPAESSIPAMERIMSGLAIGPTVPAVAKSLSPGRDFLLVSHHLYHGGSFSSVASAGLKTALCKAAAVLLLVAVLGAGTGAAVLVTLTPSISHGYKDPRVDDPAWYQGSGVAFRRILDDPEKGNYLLIRRVIPGYPADQAGLRKGDRVVEPPLARDTPEGQLFAGRAGSRIRIAVMRPQPDGTEKRLVLNLTRGFVPKHLLDEANAAMMAEEHSAQSDRK